MQYDTHGNTISLLVLSAQLGWHPPPMQQYHINLPGVKFHGTSKLSKIRLMENAGDDELTDWDEIALCSRPLRSIVATCLN